MAYKSHNIQLIKQHNKKMKNTLFWGTILIGALSLSSCSSENAPSFEEREFIKSQKKEISLDTKAAGIKDELRYFNKIFTMDAVKYVNTNDESVSKNVIVSPLSTAIVLGMIANGVDDGSRQRFMDYLGVSDLEALNSFCNQMHTQLPQCDDLVDMKIANSFWVSNKYRLTPDFSSTLQKTYEALAFYEDFVKTNDLARKINNWCAENTEELIKNFIDNVSPYCQAIAMNTLYFSAPWEDEYFIRKEDTKKATFHGLSADAEVNMMKGKQWKASCIADGRFEGCTIPFGNSAFSLNIILPKEGLSIAEATEILTPDEIDRLFRDTQDVHLTVYLPKFKLETGYNLTQILSATGMFTNIKPVMFENYIATSGDLHLIMRQGCSFQIDETGAKLAAVTEGELSTSSNTFLGENYTLTLDRPFFFFLKENGTGACLLSGLIADL